MPAQSVVIISGDEEDPAIRTRPDPASIVGVPCTQTVSGGDENTTQYFGESYSVIACSDKMDLLRSVRYSGLLRREGLFVFRAPECFGGCIDKTTCQPPCIRK